MKQYTNNDVNRRSGEVLREAQKNPVLIINKKDKTIKKLIMGTEDKVIIRKKSKEGK